jgi:TolA-binding protein
MRGGGILQISGWIVICITLCVFLSGCLATSREIVFLRDDINHLQMRLNEVQRNQAELAMEMSSINTSMVALSERLKENKNHMFLVAQRLDDMEANIISRVSTVAAKMKPQPCAQPPAATLPPSELYGLSYSDFITGRFELAARGFRDFIEKYPDAALACRALYYLAVSYFARNIYTKALTYLELLEKRHPQSTILVTAKYKRALTLERLKRTTESKSVFEEIIKNHSTSQEAQSAADRLKQLQ